MTTCKFGAAPGILKVTDNKGVYMNGKLNIWGGASVRNRSITTLLTFCVGFLYVTRRRL